MIETLSSEYCVTLFPYINERRKQTRRESFSIHQERRSFSVRQPDTFHRSQDIDLKTEGAAHQRRVRRGETPPGYLSAPVCYISKRVTIEYKLVTTTPVYVINCVISSAALLASQSGRGTFLASDKTARKCERVLASQPRGLPSSSHGDLSVFLWTTLRRSTTGEQGY